MIDRNCSELRKLIYSCEELLGFYYRSDADVNVKFVRYLLNCGDEISESIFNTIKERYTRWDNGFGNPMVGIVATIEKQKNQ